jgi:hypothetical protein
MDDKFIFELKEEIKKVVIQIAGKHGIDSGSMSYTLDVVFEINDKVEIKS